MSILDNNFDLQGKSVKVFCKDGTILEGLWTEYFDKDEFEKSGILVATKHAHPNKYIEILEDDIENIEGV